MFNNNDYFANAMNNAYERFSSADGFANDGLAFDGIGQAELYATGAVQAARPAASSAPTSLPYIINIENTTASAATSTLFGAYSVFGGATNYNNPVAIVITSGITNITYSELLAQTMQKPFECGLIYVESSNSSQITQALNITHKDANGISQTVPVIPAKDPYQNLSTVLAIRYKFKVDGFTNIQVSILANSTLTLRIYPSEIADVGRIITTDQPTRTFSAPSIGLATGPVKVLGM